MTSQGNEPANVTSINRKSLATAMEALHSSRPEKRNIAVFCSANTPDDRIYTAHARELGQLIGERGHNLIWGGTRAGTMQIMSSAAKAQGATTIAVGFFQEGSVSNEADMVFAAHSLEQRKRTMLDLSDIAIALAGGVGTLGEIASAMEEVKVAPATTPPIILLNTEGFYNSLAAQIDTMDQEGMLSRHIDDMLRLADSPAEAIRLAEAISRGSSTGVAS